MRSPPDSIVGRDLRRRPGRKPSVARYTAGQPVTAQELQAITDSALTEKAWQAEALGYLMERGWVCYHTLRSKGSAPGFPDVVALRPPVVAFIELKREPTRGNKAELTIHQTKWIDGLKRCTAVSARVYRPSDRTAFQEEFL